MLCQWVALSLKLSVAGGFIELFGCAGQCEVYVLVELLKPHNGCVASGPCFIQNIDRLKDLMFLWCRWPLGLYFGSCLWAPVVVRALCALASALHSAQCERLHFEGNICSMILDCCFRAWILWEGPKIAPVPFWKALSTSRAGYSNVKALGTDDRISSRPTWLPWAWKLDKVQVVGSLTSFVRTCCGAVELRIGHVASCCF